MDFIPGGIEFDEQQPGKQGLVEGGVYPCPICHHGQVTQMVMMEAFACNFCRHIFTPNLSEQLLKLEDSNQTFRWRWRGQRWQPQRQLDPDVTLAVWLIAMALAILPPSLVWLSYHTFPPLPDGAWPWFPRLWVAVSCLSHLILVLWILLEHYQVPGYVALRVRLLSRQFGGENRSGQTRQGYPYSSGS